MRYARPTMYNCKVHIFSVMIKQLNQIFPKSELNEVNRNVQNQISQYIYPHCEEYADGNSNLYFMILDIIIELFKKFYKLRIYPSKDLCHSCNIFEINLLFGVFLTCHMFTLLVQDSKIQHTGDTPAGVNSQLMHLESNNTSLVHVQVTVCRKGHICDTASAINKIFSIYNVS